LQNYVGYTSQANFIDYIIFAIIILVASETRFLQLSVIWETKRNHKVSGQDYNNASVTFETSTYVMYVNFRMYEMSKHFWEAHYFVQHCINCALMEQ
jgi:hypothetical protein